MLLQEDEEKRKKKGRRKGDSRRRNSALAFQIREASSLGFRSSSRTASPKSRGAASSVFSRLLLLSLRGGEEQRRHRNTQQTSAAALLLHTFFVQQTDRDLSPSAKPTNERTNPISLELSASLTSRVEIFLLALT